jgi:hypothetical protein
MAIITKIIAYIAFCVGLLYALYWYNGLPVKGGVSPRQAHIIDAAWAYHGWYPAVVQIDTIYLESPQGRIWIERNGERIWQK